MASGHEKNLNHDPDNSAFCKVGSRDKLNDSKSLPVENPVDSFSDNQNPQPLFHQHHETEPIGSQDLQTSSHHQLHQSASNIDQEASSLLRNVRGKRSSSNIPKRVPNSGESSRIQDTPLQSFQHSESRSEDNQNPQRQLGNQSIQKSGTNLIQHCGSNSATTEIPNQPAANQDLHSVSQQPIESETQKIPGRNPLPQAPMQNEPNTCQSARSQSQRHLKRKSSIVPQAESQPSSSGTNQPLPNDFPFFHFINKKSVRYDKKEGTIITIENYDVRMLKRPYSNRSESISIFLYGPTACITRMIQTTSGEVPVSSDAPYSLAFQRNILRCGIFMRVSVWQVSSIFECIDFLKASCMSSKCTIVVVYDLQQQPHFPTLELLITVIRRDIRQTVPVILVGSKVRAETSSNVMYSVIQNSLAFTTKCFKLKAKFDLSAYLECDINSEEEVAAVMLTAIDVSRLSN